MVEKRKDRMKAQPYVSKIRTVFNDGSIFEGNEVQNALVCSFTAESRGGVKSSTVIEYDTAGFNAIKIRAGARVCFHPESGEESIIDRDLEVPRPRPRDSRQHHTRIHRPNPRAIQGLPRLSTTQPEGTPRLPRRHDRPPRPGT